MSLEVDLQFLTVMVSKSLPFHGNVSISIKELNVVKDFCNIHLNSKNELTNIKLFVNLTDVSIRSFLSALLIVYTIVYHVVLLIS